MTASIKLNGALELVELLKLYPSIVTKAAAKTGLRTAARQFRKSLTIPTRSGLLAKAVKVRARKAEPSQARVFVGLGKIKGESKIRGYYKALEMKTKRGPAMRPFLLAPFEAQKSALSQMIVDETRKAVYAGAARINRKTLGLKKR